MVSPLRCWGNVHKVCDTRDSAVAISCARHNYECMPRADLINTAEAAQQLNVHRSTLTRMVQDGKIKPAVRGEGIRGGMFFYPSEIRRAKERMAAERAA